MLSSVAGPTAVEPADDAAEVCPWALIDTILYVCVVPTPPVGVGVGADVLAVLLGGADALLGAAVPVQTDDRRYGPLQPPGHEQDARHDRVHAVVEPEPLQGVAVVLLAGAAIASYPYVRYAFAVVSR